MTLPAMDTLSLEGKRVLIRADLNVSMKDGSITSTAKIDATLPTVLRAREQGARIMLMSHCGRPQEGQGDKETSLGAVAQYLTGQLGAAVVLCQDYLQQAPQPAAGEVVLLENVRFNRGELADDDTLAQRYAALCDIFVMDAFATAHRAHASTCGVVRHAAAVCAGPLLLSELEHLGRALRMPRHPMVAIVGGAKVSDKLGALDVLLDKVEQLIPGGGIANTFLAAAGHAVGRSLHEPGMLEAARGLLQRARECGREIPLPTDVVVADHPDGPSAVKAVGQLTERDIIFDIGPHSARHYGDMLEAAATILWNGPVGISENPQFAAGTATIAHAIARSKAYSLAGGGSTIAALEQCGVVDKISYISTGGGAFLEFIEGKTLPAIAALEARAAALS